MDKAKAYIFFFVYLIFTGMFMMTILSIFAVATGSYSYSLLDGIHCGIFLVFIGIFMLVLPLAIPEKKKRKAG